VGVVLQNLVGFDELDVLKVLPVDLQDLTKKETEKKYIRCIYLTKLSIIQNSLKKSGLRVKLLHRWAGNVNPNVNVTAL